MLGNRTRRPVATGLRALGVAAARRGRRPSWSPPAARRADRRPGRAAAKPTEPPSRPPRRRPRPAAGRRRRPPRPAAAPTTAAGRRGGQAGRRDQAGDRAAAAQPAAAGKTLTLNWITPGRGRPGARLLQRLHQGLPASSTRNDTIQVSLRGVERLLHQAADVLASGSIPDVDAPALLDRPGLRPARRDQEHVRLPEEGQHLEGPWFPSLIQQFVDYKTGSKLYGAAEGLGVLRLLLQQGSVR